MKVLLTGASGFVGSHLTNRLAKLGYQVLATDARPPDYRLAGGDDFIQADITKPESLSAIDGEFDAVINLASLFSYSAPKNPLLRVNGSGVENLMERIVKLQVHRIIPISSGAIYGFVPRNEQPIPETREPRPSNHYELSKWIQERIVRERSEEIGLNLVVLRPAAIYGKGSRYGVIKVVDTYLEGKLRFIPGTGRVTPALVSIDDVVGFLVHVLQNEDSTSGKIFNVADDCLHTLEELILCISEAVDLPAPRFKVPASIVRLVAHAEMFGAKLRGREPEFTPSEVEYLLHDYILDNSAMKLTDYKLLLPDSCRGDRSVSETDLPWMSLRGIRLSRFRSPSCHLQADPSGDGIAEEKQDGSYVQRM